MALGYLVDDGTLWEVAAYHAFSLDFNVQFLWNERQLPETPAKAPAKVGDVHGPE